MWRTAAALTAATLLALPACSAERRGGFPGPDATVLSGEVGPGAPPGGAVPRRLDLVFTGDGQTVRGAAVDGRYEVTLPAGTWDVRTTDGRACTLRLTLHGGSRQRHDLVYPADCRTVEAPPDGPAVQPPPPG